MSGDWKHIERVNPCERAFADKAAFQFREYADHLPHGAACRRVGVDCFREGTEGHAPVFQVIEHGDQVAQAPAQSHRAWRPEPANYGSEILLAACRGRPARKRSGIYPSANHQRRFRR